MQNVFLQWTLICKRYGMFLIAGSRADVASLNIAHRLLEIYPFNETARFQDSPHYTAYIDDKEINLILLQKETVYAQNLPNLFPAAQLLVFISRHSSIRGIPTLSVHTPGNLHAAKLGGIPRVVSVSPANAMRDALHVLFQLNEEKPFKYAVSYECTHHGPSLSIPTMFVELGSAPAQWRDNEAAEVVAHAAMETIVHFGESSAIAVLGIGGPHYNAKFTRIALENDLAFGHIIPKYVIPHIDSAILRHCITKTLETVERVLLDWKGIRGTHKSRVRGMLDEIGLDYDKV
jgi:D-aminoacyl-tRNA deacylase